MPIISTYGWPVGSIVRPTMDRTGWMYPPVEHKIIVGSESAQFVTRTNGLGGEYNGLDADWELVRLPAIREYGFPHLSLVRIVSYPATVRDGDSYRDTYGPVGSICQVVGYDVVKLGDEYGTYYVGDLAVWELVEASEATKVEETMTCEEGKLYKVIDSPRASSHNFDVGDVVECLSCLSTIGRGHFRRLDDGYTQYMYGGEYKPFEGEYKPKYTYIKPDPEFYSGYSFTQGYYPVTEKDRDSYLIHDDYGSRKWMYKQYEGERFTVMVTDEPLPLDPVLVNWGADLSTIRHFSGHYDWTNVWDFLKSALPSVAPDLKVPVFYRLLHFKPIQSRKVRGQIALYQMREKRDRDIQTTMKPGRAFRLMFPELTDAQIEVLVDKYRADYPVIDYKLHVSDEAGAFKLAYSGAQEPMQNPYTTSSRKSLANSCMRYEFDNLPNHPAEAYASGEFKIFYTTGPRGHIGSRCVVWYGHSSGRPVAGPIYGVCEHSIDTIAEALEKENAYMYGEESWVGAKMKKIPYHRCGVIAPYIDGSYQSLRDAGSHLVVSDHGEYDASTYSGVLGGYDYSCEECGDGIHEDDVHWSADGDYPYCESCFHDRHTRCDHYDDYYPNDEMTTVYTMRRGNRYELTVCQRAIDNGYYIYCESDGEYWCEDDVLLDHDEEYLDPITAESNYFRCEWSGKYWPKDQMCELTDGTLVCKDEIEADENYQLNSDGKYEKKEAA